MERRPLGQSGIEVSALALGSWRTFERLPRERGVAVMRAARDYGIAFLDDARYDDETGTAPIRSGYSEVVFGELVRAVGWRRDEVVVSNKLWWEFWPEQSAAQELDASLGRMGFDHVDLIYAERRPEGLPVERVVEEVEGLIGTGKARVWGVLNWEPADIVQAGRAARASGVPPPCAAQLPYSLIARSPVEDDAMVAALRSCGASVVASAVLAFGALTGRGATGRAAAWPREEALVVAERLRGLGAALAATPAQLALAFVLANREVATALFGASRPEQVAENAAAAELAARLDASDLDELRRAGL